MFLYQHILYIDCFAHLIFKDLYMRFLWLCFITLKDNFEKMGYSASLLNPLWNLNYGSIINKVNKHKTVVYWRQLFYKPNPVVFSRNLYGRVQITTKAL